ncbi:MAG: endo alpha-1,4 polygalactosaminidase [Chloroflexi bacterium]|nr:endo alpha-1,4 polygalactosaminidase [Chloroflexota bacterium]
MRRISIGVLLVLFFGTSCDAPATTSAVATDAAVPTALEAVPTEPPPDNEISPTVVPPLPIPIRARWQIQYTGDIDLSLDVDVYNLDLFDTDAADIVQLRGRGVFVMCYFSAGSLEDWRPDAGQFPSQVLGKAMEGWEGETWLDIRQIDLLKPIMEARLDLAVEKGCDGVDPDNVNGYTNDTGFPLTYEDQIRFNIFLAEAAHQRGLKIGLKNDLEQIPDLLPYFDWELNEECFSFNECEMLLPFVKAGKPVFVIQYNTPPGEFCPQAEEMNFNAMQKNWELDAFRVPCESDYE